MRRHTSLTRLPSDGHPDLMVADEVIDFRVRLPMDQRPVEARTKPPEYTARYDEVLAIGERRSRGLEELRSDMAAAGVTRAVVHAEYEYGDHADALNDAVAAMVDEHRARFWGFGTVSLAPLSPQRAAGQVATAASLGLAGLNIQPAFFDVPMDDRRLYPVYSKATELGLVVAIHTGTNYVPSKRIELEHPLRLDRIAGDFPDLRLVACHAGWPWVTEIVAVARRHRSVYLDFGGMAPKYVGEAGTGWEIMRRYMDGLLADRVLFASDWPAFPMARSVAEWATVGLKSSTYLKLVRDNALSLLVKS